MAVRRIVTGHTPDGAAIVVSDDEVAPIAIGDRGSATTLLWGRQDRMVPLAVAEAAAARHGWPLHVIDHTAHAPHIEQPDAFARTVTAITTTG